MPGAFTFINILPLPRNPVGKALQFLIAYLRCVRPVILPSFGQRAAESVLSGFKTFKNRIRMSNLASTLGTHPLSIRLYGDDKDDVFIHIPLHHLGRY